MLKTIALVLVVAILAVLGFAATRPDSFRVERSKSINAPADSIYPLINDFTKWTTWSPWEKLDPALKRAYSGASSGKGAVYAWDGNKDVGAGRMEITDESKPSKVVIKLDFIRPFEGHNTAEFKLVPKGEATDVTWAMYGPMPFISKVMSLFVSMDSLIGKDFEAGLSNLATAAQK